MNSARLPPDDIAAVRSGLSLLGHCLRADRAALYQVGQLNLDGNVGLELVASGARPGGDFPAPFPIPGAITDICYLPDMGQRAPPGVGTYFGVPLVSGGQMIGLVELIARRVDAFSPVERQDVVTFVPVLGSVLENARRRQAKSAFLVLAAHELRTPLASAAGFAQTIAQQLDRLEPIVVRDLLGRILHSHRRLDRLVDDLVDLSSVDGGQLQVSLAPVVVGPLLEEVMCVVDNGSHDVSYDVPADLPLVWADRDRLDQVVTNLVVNATKFSPEGSSIAIQAAVRGDMIAIEVVDQGPGIPPERLPRIFDAYYQGETLSGDRPQGLGIGLYLTRVLCHLMAGTVSVESCPGKGSTFVVALPAVTSAESRGER